MSQNPYAQFGSPGSPQAGGGMGGDFIDPVQSRTSIMAIIGLVISIVGCLGCFIPGPGAFAAILGGLSVFFIARSSGRLTGMGLAVTAIVLGLFQSVAWIAVATGVSQAYGQYEQAYSAPIGKMMTAIESGDMPGARLLLTADASAAITDEDFKAFAKNYQATYGAFQRTPHGPWEAVMMFADGGRANKNTRGGGPIIQPHGGSPEVPVPGKFSNGIGLVTVMLDPTAMHNADKTKSPAQIVLNVGVLSFDGQQIWLIDPDKAAKLIHRGSRSGTNSGPDSPPSTPNP